MELVFLQYAVVLLLMTTLAILMGRWLAHAFADQNHTAVERLSYRMLGVNPEEPMNPDFPIEQFMTNWQA